MYVWLAKNAKIVSNFDINHNIIRLCVFQENKKMMIVCQLFEVKFILYAVNYLFFF